VKDLYRKQLDAACPKPAHTGIAVSIYPPMQPTNLQLILFLTSFLASFEAGGAIEDITPIVALLLSK